MDFPRKKSMSEDRFETPPSTSPAASRRTSRSLLQRARDQQPEAWQRLVVLYDPLVRHWCRRAGVLSQDVDDILQEVFVKAFASLDTFRHSQPSDTFRGWLHGLTRHRLLEHFRRVRRVIPAGGGTDAFGVILNQPEMDGGPDDEERELCSKLYRRILDILREEFEPQTWKMFWRSVIDSLPTDAVAAELHVSRASVRQARSRVLRRMRQEIADLNLA
jgi:RNA polymerase sigma-70 factor, ECF subfamily